LDVAQDRSGFDDVGSRRFGGGAAPGGQLDELAVE